MPHDPRTVANWFIQRGIAEGNPLTHIEVQKLLYFSHGWMLGIHGESLVSGDWEAWHYGPVLPEIYFRLNRYQGAPISELLLDASADEFSERERTILQGVYDYRLLGTFTLVDISHDPKGPWYRVRNNGKGSNVIHNRAIRRYFAYLHSRRGEKYGR